MALVRWGQIRRIGWVIKTLEAQVEQFLLGCKCPVGRGIVVQEQDPLGDLPAEFFLQNVLHLHHQRWVIVRIDNLALWKIINEEDATLIPTKSRQKIFQQIYALRIFWGGLSRYAATPMIVALSPGHSDILGFVCGHQSWKEIIWTTEAAQTTGTIDVFCLFFPDPLRTELPPVQILMNDGPNPLTWDAQLLSYWFSRNPVVFQD